MILKEKISHFFLNRDGIRKIYIIFIFFFKNLNQNKKNFKITVKKEKESILRDKKNKRSYTIDYIEIHKKQKRGKLNVFISIMKSNPSPHTHTFFIF